jgi:hypothetical protein
MKPVAIVLLGVVLAAGFFALVSPNKEHNGEALLSLAGASEANSDLPVLRLIIDDTSSIRPETRKSEIARVDRQLPAIISSGHFRKGEVGHFGSNGWFTQEREFTIPQLADEPCAEAKADDFFQNPNQRAKEQAEQQCKERKREAQHQYNAQLTATLDSIRQVLNETPNASDNCTAFYDVLESLTLDKRPGKTIIVSDAVETCSKQPSGAIPAPANGVEAIAIIVPSRDHLGERRSGFQAFAQTKTRLAKIAPWLKVLAPNEEIP